MEQSLFLQTVAPLFGQEGITEFGCIPYADAILLNPRLSPQDARSAILLLAPYDTGETYTDGVSAYAHICDYHRFYTELYGRLLPKLQELFPKNRFYGFADHSPINEKDAAAKAGLGVIGCHSLLLNPVYGSYVFIGSLLTDLEIDCRAEEIRFCEKCGRCKEHCPGQAITDTGILPERCLSALSQKKRLTAEEAETLKRSHIAWGCDRCQESCPHNSGRKPTAIPFFSAHRHGDFSAREIREMDDAEFASYAFSWRGRERIVQNLQNLAKEQENS